MVAIVALWTGGWMEQAGQGETGLWACHDSERAWAPCLPTVSLQSCIVTHESNGIDIITALILNDISPLCKYRMDLVLQLKVGPWQPMQSCMDVHVVCVYIYM